MHLNYHFLKFLCPELSNEFAGKTILSCFSQSKDELILETSDENETRWIRAHLLPPDIYLSFPTQFHRAKRNSIDLFPELIGDKILACNVFDFERGFYFQLQSGKHLVLKLHGNRSNVLLFEEENPFPKILFRNGVKEDKELEFKSLFRLLDLTREKFDELEGNASKFLPTLGQIPRNWLKERGYPEADLDTKWELMESLLDILDSPLYALVELDGQVHLSLLPESNPLKTFSNPIEACNEVFYLALVKGSFEREKNSLLKNLQESLKRTNSYLEKSGQKLQELKTSAPPSRLADVIMANLHMFNPGDSEVELFDFYTQSPVKVKLKPNQKPQEIAENLYRKSKNRQVEIDQIEKTLEAKRLKQKEILEEIERVSALENFKSLKAFQKTIAKEDKSKPNTSGLPFKVFEFEGFTIWVGKSAKDNDEMLRGYVHKDDLWLHARQVPGSHVVIKTKGMPKVPSQVLERAAGLAAFYSKLKSDSLAPVIYTEAKFVRKVKGSAPGSVMVDREKVIMVPPKGPEAVLFQND
ncbi:putative ribosome quality control (RQC) complex YloA/Tae2 family protein [Algoriphagus boseongensis]|uniref:Putative ribosome quality control (RQC) complex YloA/Tae2 family protein n=1 Tax=Algoriphagus boseongensis TaxID=1442587 RepID=A0A4R6T8L7_9BACT|nr:NFACT RNA binding domain-containing protein [Algoriphagus boseongensis]TDQ18569.1 putative ribosome quality control (RQC) complex YloA/Tae2 family protein [Algoriphagus boseongensis]